MPDLTKRECEVLSLIGGGLCGRQVAETLRISEFTVRKHRASIMRKLALHSSAHLVAYAVTTSEAADGAGGLRPRERQVVELVAKGLTSKEIARVLSISPLTVRKHRENAMRRLGVHTLGQLIRAGRALAAGDTPSEPFREPAI